MSQPEFSIPEVVPEPSEPTPLENVERVLSATILYEINPMISQQPETHDALAAVIGYIRPPEQRPRGREDFEEPGSTDFYEAYHTFASRKNATTGKFEPLDRTDVMKCTQTIWDRMNSATNTLTAMQRMEAVTEKDMNIASWILVRVGAIIKAGKITFNQPE